jgi:RimJ/RimL family protein N-acetyltransferase
MSNVRSHRQRRSMPKPIEFSTERLRLRQWRPSDVEPFSAINADPRVMEFFPSTLSREATSAGVQRLQEQIANRGFGLWAAEVRASNQFIGFVGLEVTSAALPFTPCVEVGWRLGFAHWGLGYASEAAKGALRVGFEELGLQEIVSFTAIHNRRSRAVMERLGMKESTETFEHPSVPEGNPLREHCLYRLPLTEWQNHGT